MIPQVTLPVPVDQIPSELKRLDDHVIALKAEIEMCHALKKVVRAGCPHPANKRGRWSDYSGDSGTICRHCGAEI